MISDSLTIHTHTQTCIYISIQTYRQRYLIVRRKLTTENFHHNFLFHTQPHIRRACLRFLRVRIDRSL